MIIHRVLRVVIERVSHPRDFDEKILAEKDTVMNSLRTPSDKLRVREHFRPPVHPRERFRPPVHPRNDLVVNCNDLEKIQNFVERENMFVRRFTPSSSKIKING